MKKQKKILLYIFLSLNICNNLTAQVLFTDSGQLLGKSDSRGVSLGDLDNDGDLDAFVANFGSNRIWINNGNGYFTESEQFFDSSKSYNVILLDIDIDGDLDAIEANQGRNVLWFNNGDATFTKGDQVFSDYDTPHFDYGDLNNDGYPDLFITNFTLPGFTGFAPIEILFNDGTGKFTDSGQILQGLGSRDVELADFDGDGDLDAFISNHFEFINNINLGNGNPPNQLFLNDGTGVFSDSGQKIGNSVSDYVKGKDVDGDGDIDILVANPFSANYLWINDGSGNFSLGQEIDSKTRNISLSDIDNDKDYDAIILKDTGENSIWLNDGSGNFSKEFTFNTKRKNLGLDVADIDNDNDPDLFLTISGKGDDYKFNMVYLNYLNNEKPSGKIISLSGSVFQGLGDLHGDEFKSSAAAISDDGKIIVGAGKTSTGSQAYRWSEEQGMISLGNLPDSLFLESWGNNLNADGSIIVGYGHTGTFWVDNKGFVWSSDNGMNLLESYNDKIPFSCNAVSTEGNIIVGKVDDKPYKWSSENRIQVLEIITGFHNGNAADISADGKTILGSCYNDDWSREQTCLWTDEDGLIPIEILDGDRAHFPNALSNNGKFVVGTRYGNDGSSSAYIWSADNGMTIINALPGKPTIHPLGVTDDGKTVVGASFSGPTKSSAFIWDRENGTRSLKTVLQNAYQLDLSDWELINAFDITSDGKFITGSGINPDGNEEAYRIMLITVDSPAYFGQIPPGNTPEIFAPGIISLSNRLENQLVFSPDGNECYFQIYSNDYSSSKILFTTLNNGTWSDQIEAPFSENLRTGRPSFSADGNKIFFNVKEKNDYNIYCAERTQTGWGNTQLLPEPINSSAFEMSYSETNSGIVYIDSRRTGGTGIDIWCIRKMSDETLHAENLGSTINSTDWDFNPCIAPDESYLIFASDRFGRKGLSRLYVSFNKGNGEWTEPVDLNSNGALVNSDEANQGGPSLSPDGKYLFFFRHVDETEMDVYWVSTKVIDVIKSGLTGIN